MLRRLDAIEDRLSQLTSSFERLSWRSSNSGDSSGRDIEDVRKSLEVIKKRLGC